MEDLRYNTKDNNHIYPINAANLLSYDFEKGQKVNIWANGLNVDELWKVTNRVIFDCGYDYFVYVSLTPDSKKSEQSNLYISCFSKDKKVRISKEIAIGN